MNAVASILEPDALSANTRVPFAAFLCDDTSGQTLLPIIGELGWTEDMIFNGGVSAGVRMLGGMPCPEFLIVDLSESSDPRADIQSLADVCEAGTAVLAIGTINDVTLYRDLISAGVHDYLIKPLDGNVLREAILIAQDALKAPDIEEAGPQTKTSNEKVVFIGVRGGLGASTAAANIAWLMAEKKQPTVLLDLDLYFGTSAMQFDLEPGRGLADALDNPERVDGLFLERAVVKPHEMLSILGAEAPVGSMQEPVEGALQHLVNSLSENFKNVVVDVPRQILGQHADLLRAAKDIVLITDYSITAARDCIRLLAHIRQTAPDAKIHIVASRGVGTGQEVPEKDFENSVEHAVAITLPLDPKTVMAATQHSKLVVDGAPNSKLAAAYGDILRLITPDAEASGKKPGWFKKLARK